jgi:predicted dienelactone hydrolase
MRRTALGLLAATAVLLSGCASRTEVVRELRGGSESATPSSSAPASVAVAAPYEIEVREFEWRDAARGRVVPGRLYQPRGASGVPLVVFSHGLGGSRFGYSHLGRHWASHGIATLHLQHAGSDRTVWASQGLSVVGALRSAATVDNAIARVRDVSFALDRVFAEPALAGAIDPARVGVAGHSFGANTALLASGARFRENGSVLGFADPRIRAALVLSAPSLPAEQDPAFVYSGIAVPTMHLTGTLDVTPIPGLSTSAEERRVAFDSIAMGPRYLGVFEGGRHSMFNDWSRDATTESIRASARALTLAFWRSVFDGDPGAAAVLEAPARAAPAVAATLANWETRR